MPGNEDGSLCQSGRLEDKLVEKIGTQIRAFNHISLALKFSLIFNQESGRCNGNKFTVVGVI